MLFRSGALIRNPEAFEILTRNKIQTLEQMKEFSRKYQLHPKEAELSVTLFIRELGKRGIIGLAPGPHPGHPNGPGPGSER